MERNVPGNMAVKQISSISFCLTAGKKNHSGRWIRILIWSSAGITLALLLGLLGYIVLQGIPALKLSLFSWQATADNQSMLPGILNTVFILFLTLLFALSTGIGAAVFLTEYMKPKSPGVRMIMALTETLASVPSIVFGLFGMIFFVKGLGMGNSLLAGSLTMTLMVLPVIIQSTREALLALPASYRESSCGLGAGKCRTVFTILLPAAVPGIVSGIRLSMGRIAGETAALIYTAGTISQAAWIPAQSGGTLAVYMYKMMNEGLFLQNASAAAVVLLLMTAGINCLADVAERRLKRV